MQYQYDVFVSYRREDPVKTWVSQFFVPELRQWLQALRGSNRVFFDEDGIDAGMSFAPKLAQALTHSQIMICVWTPGYFQSAWCWAELETMRRREQQTSMRTAAKPQGLFLPVRFFDGENFPKEFNRELKQVDFEPYALTAPGWRSSQQYANFQLAIQSLCKELDKMMKTAPKFAAWPLVMPKEVTRKAKQNQPDAKNKPRYRL